MANKLALPELKTIDRYDVVAPLGEGGMGSVYLVSETGASAAPEAGDAAPGPETSRRYALKLLRKTADPTGLSAARLRREFGLLSSLRHRNLVEVYRMGVHEGSPYYTMEVIHGESIAQHPAFAKPVEADLWGEHRQAVFQILLQLVDGIEYVHQRGVIHRDLKPSNILLSTDGTVKIMDFGLAREAESSLAANEPVVGTLEYSSPEHFGPPEAIDVRSDLYSLGVVLYELVCGRSPYAHGSSLLTDILYGPAPDPLDANPLVPIRLRDLIVGLLQKEPDQRLSSVSDIRTGLLQLAASVGWSLQLEEPAGDVARPKSLFVPRFILSSEDEARLEQFLSDVRHGFNSVLFVEGDTGSGKTRWVEEIRRLAQRQGVRVLRAGADRSSMVPYGAIQVLLAQVPERASTLDLAETQAAPDDQRVGTDRMHEMISRRVRTLARQGPLLVLVDDVHDMQPDTLELLLYLARDLGQRRREADYSGIGFAWFFTSHAGEGVRHLTPNLRIALKEFDMTSMEHYLASVLGDAECAVKLAPQVHRATGGNPHFAFETLKALVEKQSLRYYRTGWKLEDDPSGAGVLPGSLQSIYERRLAEVSPVQLALLHTASLLGGEFSFDDLKRCTPSELELATLVDDLISRKILRTVPDRRRGLLGFSESQMRRHLLDQMHDDDSRERRQTIVRALETAWQAGDRRVLHALAHHASALGADDRAAQYLLLAAEFARKRYANEQASDLYEEALRLTGGPEGDFARLSREVRSQMASVLMAAGRFERASQLAEASATLVSDPVDRAHWLHMLGRCRMGQGRHAEALEYFQSALGVLGVKTPTQGPGLLASVASNFALHLPALTTRGAGGEVDPARRLVLRILADLPNLFYFVHLPHREAYFFNSILLGVRLADQSAETDLRSVIFATYGFMLCMAPRPPLWLIYRLLRPPVERLRSMVDIEAAVEVARFAGYGYYLMGNMDDAHITLRLGMALAHRAANARGVAQCGTLYATNFWWRGPVGEMEEAAHQALHKCQAIQDETFETFATGALAVALAYQQQRTEAEKLLATALLRYPPDSDSADPMSLMFAQAWAAAIERDDETALERFERLQVRWEKSATDHVHPVRAGLLAAGAALRLLEARKLTHTPAWEDKLEAWMRGAERLGASLRYVAGHRLLVLAQYETLHRRLDKARAAFAAGVDLVRQDGATIVEMDGRMSWAQQLIAIRSPETLRMADREVALSEDVARKLGATAYTALAQRLRDDMVKAVARPF